MKHIFLGKISRYRFQETLRITLHFTLHFTLYITSHVTLHMTSHVTVQYECDEDRRGREQVRPSGGPGPVSALSFIRVKL